VGLIEKQKHFNSTKHIHINDRHLPFVDSDRRQNAMAKNGKSGTFEAIRFLLTNWPNHGRHKTVPKKKNPKWHNFIFCKGGGEFSKYF
jgi:hypothetical protein